MAQDVVFRLLAETEKAQKEIEAFRKTTQKQLGFVEKALSNANQSFNVFKGALLANIATSAISAVTSSIGSLVDLIANDAIKNSENYAEALLGVQRSLELTGKATPGAIKGLEDFAATMQETTRFSDDTVLSTASYIQALGNLSTDQLPRATKAALDLASATGKDLSVAQDLVAKAAAGQVSTFSRYGIAVKKGKDDTETFANALTVLEKKFGGAAEKGVNTFTGATAQLKNAFESNLLKTIGDLVVRSPAVIGAIRGITQVVNQFTKFLADQSAGGDFFAGLIEDAIAFGKGINDYIIRPAIFLGNVFGGVFDLIRGWFQIAIVETSLFAEGIARALNLVGVVSDETKQSFVDFRESATEQLAEFAKGAADSFGKAFSGSAFADTVDSALTTIGTSAKNQLEALPGIANSSFGAVVTEITEAQKKIRTDARALAEGLGDEDFLRDKFQNEVALLQVAENKKLEILRASFEERKADFAAEGITLAQLELTTRQEFDELLAVQAQTQADRLVAIEAQKEAAVLGVKQLNEFQKMDIEKKVLQERLAAGNLEASQREAINKRIVELEKAKANAILGLNSQLFGNLMTLSQGSNKELFEISKSAAIANATVQGALAVSNALATVPFFPLGLIMAAVAATNAAIQIKTITAQQFAGGLTEVPPGFENDSFPAFLQTGERVIDRRTNSDLKDFLNEPTNNETLDDSGSSDVLSVLAEILGAIRSSGGDVVVNIGNEEIIRSVRSGLRSGGSLAV